LLLLAAACAAPDGTSPEPADAVTEEPVSIVSTTLTAGVATSADGSSIAYSTKGGGSPALIFIHGWSCDRTYWSDQLDAFAADYQVVAVDLAGHGDSSVDRSQWTLESFGEDVRAVVEDLGLEEVVLVGHSMGGPVALEAARVLSGQATGVVLADSILDPDLDFGAIGWDEIMKAYRQDFAGTCDTFVRSMFLEDAPQELVDRVQKDMCSAPREIALSLLDLFPEYDEPKALGAAGVPIRSINAAVFPTNVDAFNRYVDDYDVAVMEGVGHLLMAEKPEEFNGHLRGFLSAFPSPSS